ncbi:MAG: glycosyltransferase family 2 protein [Bacteroidetes bacterium]|nr:glycosyltransferase family 2 protein [Bacteroidota bacterium]
MKDYSLTISIVNWNNRDFVKGCIQSILDTVDQSHISYEIIVVDNASSDGSVQMVQAEFSKVKLIANAENRGFAGANNQAISESKSRYILLLNPDVVFIKDDIENMVLFLNENPEIAGVAPKFLYPDGKIQQFYYKFPNLVRMLLFDINTIPFLRKYFSVGTRLWERYRIIRIPNGVNEEPFDVDELPGACMMFRKSIIDAIGKMDGGYPLFFEEVDLCYRIKKGGNRLMFLPTAEVIHYMSESVKLLDDEVFLLRWYTGALRFFSKHKGEFQTALLKISIFLNALITIIIRWWLLLLGEKNKTNQLELEKSLFLIKWLVLGKKKI